MKRLKAALLGLKGVGGEYLAAIRADDQFELVAAAETDPDVLRRYAEESSVRLYEDYRSLIVETAHAGLDVLFVALEPFQSHEFVLLAAKCDIGVYHKAPVARNVREARRLLGPFDDAGRPLVVSRSWQWEPAFAKLANLEELVGRIHAATVRVETADGPIGWRGDSARAGGGVLLNGAYEHLDMLTTLLGVPEEVYAQCSMMVAPGMPRKYDTEDAASLTLRFKGERIASVAVSNGAAEPSWHSTLVGDGGTVDLSAERMTITPREGFAASLAVRTKHAIAPAISAFGANWLAGEKRMPSTAKEHLATLAVIDAAYLSARTASPESPGRLLDELSAR